jgi:hypothetical protein
MTINIGGLTVPLPGFVAALTIVLDDHLHGLRHADRRRSDACWRSN